jgi:hypothetical protein
MSIGMDHTRRTLVKLRSSFCRHISVACKVACKVRYMAWRGRLAAAALRRDHACLGCYILRGRRSATAAPARSLMNVPASTTGQL